MSLNKRRKDDAPCEYCGETINHRIKEKWKHYRECNRAKEVMIKNIDYCECPICGLWGKDIGRHMVIVHKLDKKTRKEIYPNLIIRCKSCVERTENTNLEKYGSASHLGNKNIRRKITKTFLEKYGVENPFASDEIQEKIKITNQERYGVDHPMQNEEIFIKQQKSANQSPNLLEQFFDEYTCDNVVFIGYGGRYIRTKTGIHKYGRLIKDLCPDFMIFPDNVLQSAISRSKEKKRLSSNKHRSRYVIELLGDYYHSEKVIGIPKEEHEKEIVEAYSSANIKCLIIWEEDITKRWNEIREEVGLWIQNAVDDMNTRPIYKKTTKKKMDNRKAKFVCPYGSNRTFKTEDQLNAWIVSEKNLYRPELKENIDYVVCQICGKRFRKLGSHIRREHGLLVEEYKIKYPDFAVISVEDSQRVSKENQNKIKKGKYKKRIAYRLPNGKIVRRKEAWKRAWGNENPPKDSILDVSEVNLDPWDGLVEGEDYVVCTVCGFKGKNIKRHVKREHDLDRYEGPFKSKKCIQALSDAANNAWKTRKLT